MATKKGGSAGQMMAIADAIEAFALKVTIPLIDREQNTFGVVGTGTLFNICGRIFLVTAASIVQQAVHN
jgi:hypothetical protein